MAPAVQEGASASKERGRFRRGIHRCESQEGGLLLYKRVKLPQRSKAAFREGFTIVRARRGSSCCEKRARPVSERGSPL